MTRLVKHLHGGEQMAGIARHPRAYDRIARWAAGGIHRRAVFDACVVPLPDDALVVDIGTGPGRLAITLARELPRVRVEGVDQSPEKIEYAQRMAIGATGTPRFRVSDVAELPYEPESVDLIVSTASAHHWADLSAGIGELRRVLRPGAQSLIYDARPVLREALSFGREWGMHASMQPLRGGFGRLILRAPGNRAAD